jgi:hypothetical protein
MLQLYPPYKNLVPRFLSFRKERQGTQIEDDLLVPRLLPAQSDETIELSGI